MSSDPVDLMTTSYDAGRDPVIQALMAEAAADADVIGLVLTGSRAVGAVAPDSDYDVVFVVTDAALDRYTPHGAPARGGSIVPPLPRADLWHEAPRTLTVDAVVPWMLPAWAEARVLYDRTGETARVVAALRVIPAARVRDETARWYDTYLNALYRSLKAWRRGNTLGGRLEAAEAVGALLHTLFALDGQWCPYSSRLPLHLGGLAGQGWDADDLRTMLLTLTASGDPHVQQQMARRVVALLGERGFDQVLRDWHGQIEDALCWTFA